MLTVPLIRPCPRCSRTSVRDYCIIKAAEGNTDGGGFTMRSAVNAAPCELLIKALRKEQDYKSQKSRLKDSIGPFSQESFT